MIYTSTSVLRSVLPNSAVTNSEYLFWHNYWQTIRDCLMGEILIKANTTRYLPRLDKQTDAEYQAYLQRATFYNATARTVSGLVGSVHSRPPVIDNLPDTMDLGSVTNDGQSFEMFMKRITREVVSLGRYGIMIDAPPDGGDPYFAGYDAEDIVDWSSSRTGSRDRLDYVILRETSRERSPFKTSGKGSEVEESYRYLFIDEDGFYKQRVYVGKALGTDDYEEFIPLLQGAPMTEIPFIFVSPYDFGFEIEKPPILDIALLNLSHYRSYAQLEAGRFYTATPVYTVFLAGGGDEDAEYTVGPNTVWQLGGNDKAEIMEFSGAGLRFLETALVTKEQQIAALGGKLSTQSAGVAAESADAIIARERGEASFLGALTSTMSEVACRLLTALSVWRGTPAKVVVSFASEATQIYLDGREIRALAMLYDTGLVPMETIFMIFRQNNIIPRGVSFEEFKGMLPEYSPKVVNKVDEAAQKADIEVEKAASIAEDAAKIAKKYPEPAAKPPQAPPMIAPKKPVVTK